MEEQKEAVEAKVDAPSEVPNNTTDRIKLAAAAAGVLLLAVWLTGLYPSFAKRRAMVKELEPVLKEAKSLGLEYDAVLSDPEKYRDRAVLWCVQTGDEGAAFYKGDLGRRLFVKNHPAMPAVRGSKHSSCADMLLRVEGARKLGSTGVVTVRFVHKLD